MNCWCTNFVMQQMPKSGAIMICCVFHKEKTPSLRIWASGHFKCYGCGTAGRVEEHAEVQQVFERSRAALLETEGQLRLPGF